MKQVFVVTLALVALCAGLNAQNRTRFGGEVNAADYAYGILPNGAGPLQVASGNAVTGSGTVTLVGSAVTLGDGRVIYPLATNAPIIIDAGSNSETITPTAVSQCQASFGYQTCQVTATWTKTHGTGALITSGTVGLQEAINNGGGTGGGGVVLVDGNWSGFGGTTAMLAAAAPFSNVSIKDNRPTAVNPYWAMQPSTLTVLGVPTTLTATNIVFTAATGTWAASSTHFTATCVDALGGESAQSADYTQTPTVNYTLTVPVSPTCSTGSVGWRLYAGTSSLATSYLLPVTAANCTLTTLESVYPACAIGATGTWAATFVSSTSLAPGAIGVTNTSNPVPQGHTTFAYQPTGSLPQVFQTNYGPFGSGSIASATASDLTPLGSFNLPSAFLNTIGRTVRITGKISLTAGASSTLGITIGAAWAGGLTAGAPITVCNPISGFVWATHAYTSVNFSCTMTTNAVGATAVGSIMPESMFMGGYAAGTLIPVGTDNTAAVIGSLGLFSQNEFTVFLAPLVAADTTVQLQSLHIEVLQ